MSVNLGKHREKILAAYHDVLDEKTGTDWAMFSYEGVTNDLKVTGTGDGGLDEVMEDLNSGKIMYVFVRISDPKTGMTKFILINWQGEGAPVVRKGVCANHIRDISKLLSGAHLTIYARTEDDIDKDKILQNLNLVGNSVNIKESRNLAENDAPRGPVGTTYSRVIPTRDINTTERDNFWKKEEEEEKRRLDLEREKKRQEQTKAEEDRRRQENAIKDKVSQKQEAQNNLTKLDINAGTKQESSKVSSPTRILTGAEKLRQERNQEAKMLIGSRVLEAKAMFVQNTTQAPVSVAPAKPIRKINTVNPAEIKLAAETEEIAPKTVSGVIENEPQIAELNEDEADQFSTIKRSPYSKQTTEEVVTTPEQQESPKATSIEQPLVQNNGNENLVTAEEEIIQGMMEDMGLKARALYDYQAADESEITFDPGDIITHIDQIDEGWWQGLGPDGTYGLFPANYVELIQ